ncbi:hypothetical protein V5799_024996 [Amblyomma americanum]|uniref:Uncharacterized protein n=1 Tax=Amblyomma americanum TaxID=6943 RepID=A0AAQ4EAU6_AMBAM
MHILITRPAVGRVLSISGIVASMSLTLVFTLLYDLGPTWLFREYKPGTRNTYTEMVYIRPYTRVGVFLTGMLAGEFLSHRRKINIHKSYVLIHHFVLALVAATVLSLFLEQPFVRLEALVAQRLAARRTPSPEPMVQVPRIERHWLDKGHENPAFAKEKL